MKNWVEAAAAKTKQNKQQPTSAKKRGDQWKENWSYCALCIHDIRTVDFVVGAGAAADVVTW